MIENVIVRSSAWRKEDIETLFGDEEVHITDAENLQTLMFELNVFGSKSAAMRAGRQGPIPEGFTFEFKASKRRRLWIWNPTE